MEEPSLLAHDFDSEKTLLINAGVVVAHQAGEHRILHDGVVVIRGNEIIHVGRSWDGRPDEVMDARNKVVTPGFITTHLHAGGSPLDKSWIEDIGTRQFSYSGLPEMLPARGGAMNEAGERASADYSQIELLKTGTTTMMEQGGTSEYILEAVRRSGIRAYIAPIFKSGRWLTRNGSKIEYEWSPEAGEAGLDYAIQFIKDREAEGDDRIRGSSRPRRSTPPRKTYSSAPKRRATHWTCRSRCTRASRSSSSTRWCSGTA
ncbi:amidohydrolase family protein [Microbacterium lushaniae]|uniref:amidohydrolase family protein n=1 Tax=Microbacterium lushaniae TaxID=2614639 RepID=UPI001930F6C7|nr:amidohydrolase family protein [Microbacterium lushaniae]